MSHTSISISKTVHRLARQKAKSCGMTVRAFIDQAVKAYTPKITNESAKSESAEPVVASAR